MKRKILKFVFCVVVVVVVVVVNVLSCALQHCVVVDFRHFGAKYCLRVHG